MAETEIKRLALILAIQAEIEGMKLENDLRGQYNEAFAYSDSDLQGKSEELRVLAYKYGGNL